MRCRPLATENCPPGESCSSGNRKRGPGGPEILGQVADDEAAAFLRVHVFAHAGDAAFAQLDDEAVVVVVVPAVVSVACRRISSTTVSPSQSRWVKSTETSATKSSGNSSARKRTIVSGPIMWSVKPKATLVALSLGASHSASPVNAARMRPVSRLANALHASVTARLICSGVMLCCSGGMKEWRTIGAAPRAGALLPGLSNPCGAPTDLCWKEVRCRRPAERPADAASFGPSAGNPHHGR